jgi:hypothetical protein
MGRLLGAVAQNPRVLGIGIDEDTAIVVEDEASFFVLGSGAVYVVDGSGVTHSNIADEKTDRPLSLYDVALHVLSSGDRFDCASGAPASCPAARRRGPDQGGRRGRNVMRYPHSTQQQGRRKRRSVRLWPCLLAAAPILAAASAPRPATSPRTGAAPAPAAVRTALRGGGAECCRRRDERAFEPLMTLVGDARFVLIGEATHGTHEFYRDRARITQRLIAEKGFTGVAIEGDWPDAERVDRFVLGGGGPDAERALFPASRAASRAGCGPTPTCAISSAGSARQPRLPPARPRRLSTGLDVYSSAPPRTPWSHAGGDRSRGRGRATPHTRVSPVSCGAGALRLAALGGGRPGPSGTPAEQFEELERMYRQGAGGADAVSRGCALLPRCRTPAWSGRRGVLPDHVPRRRASWNLRDKHMADTLDALASTRRRGGTTASRARSWSGRTTATSGRALDPDRSPRSGTSGSSRASATRDAVLIGFTPTRGR